MRTKCEISHHSHKSSQLTAISSSDLSLPKNCHQPWRTAAVADTSLAASLIAAAASINAATGTTNNVSQASNTAKAAADANQPAGVDVMMSIHNINTEGAVPAPIPPLSNNNHAYTQHNNGRYILFNNQLGMGACADSSAIELGWLNKSGKFLVFQSLCSYNRFLLTLFAYFYYCQY